MLTSPTVMTLLYSRLTVLDVNGMMRTWTMKSALSHLGAFIQRFVVTTEQRRTDRQPILASIAPDAKAPGDTSSLVSDEEEIDEREQEPASVSVPCVRKGGGLLCSHRVVSVAPPPCPAPAETPADSSTNMMNMNDLLMTVLNGSPSGIRHPMEQYNTAQAGLSHLLREDPALETREVEQHQSAINQSVPLGSLNISFSALRINLVVTDRLVMNKLNGSFPIFSVTQCFSF